MSSRPPTSGSDDVELRGVSGTPGSHAVNPYVFIGGCLRSGTTMARRILDSHPELAVIHETQWLPRWFERRKGLTSDGLVTPELVARVAQHPRFSRLEMERTELEAIAEEPGLHYSEFVTRVFDHYGRKRGKRLVGEKSPGYIRHIVTLHALWPTARFVHIIRDGRDVALSVLSWKKKHKLGEFPTWELDPISTVALWWEWHVRLGREDGGGLGRDRYIEVRYEDLVTSPERECLALCSRLPLDYDGAMLFFFEGQRVRGEGWTARGPGLPVTAGLRNWRAQMSRDDIERFEAVAGPLLDELGCERATSRTPGPAADASARLRRAFMSYLEGHGRTVPKAWAGF